MIYRCNFCGDLFNKKLKSSSIFEQVLCSKCCKTILKKDVTIGIGIPHYKEDDEIFLKALKSIDNQKFDFSKLKVIIVTDGGGKEVSSQILDQLVNIKPICIYHKENTKAGGCRNTAIANLDTDYIMFLDADDILLKNALNTLYKKVWKHKPEIYCTSILEEYENKKCRKLNNLMCLNMLHGKVFERDALIKYNAKFINNRLLGEDFKFMLHLYNKCDKIIFDTNIFTYKWQYNNKSITRTMQDDNDVDVFFRTLESTMIDLDSWFSTLYAENKFVNCKLISLFYNILYYKIMTIKVNDKEKYLKQFFSLINIDLIDYNLLDKIDKKLNRKLMRNIELFSKAMIKYGR